MNTDVVDARRAAIRQSLRSLTVLVGQLDLNGKCNAKCWFCPVKYHGNPTEFAAQMSVEDLDLVLRRLRTSPLIPQTFEFLYTSHYNEILLYRNFEEMLSLLRKYRFRTTILSNGTPLNPDKTDIILAYQDVVAGIALNIPALEAQDWARKAGFPVETHRILLRNLDYLHGKYPASVQINCTTDTSILREQGIGNTKVEVEKIRLDFVERYPQFNVYLNDWLSDRAGNLATSGVLSRNQLASRPVVSCAHSMPDGGRVFRWIHVNAKGDMFICCDDYAMEYRFGNLIEKPFEDIWLSDEHVDVIMDAQNRMCRTCTYRVEAKDDA